MISQYLQAALDRAHYDIIDDEEPYYGEVPELASVWANGKDVRECRKNLAEVIEGWALLRCSLSLDFSCLLKMT